MLVTQEVVEKYKMKAKVFEEMFENQKGSDISSLVFFAKINGDEFQPVHNPFSMIFLESENHFLINLMGKLENDFTEKLSSLSAVEREYIFDLLDKTAAENKRKYERNEYPRVNTTENLLRALRIMPKAQDKEKVLEQYQMLEMIKKYNSGSASPESIRPVLLSCNFHQVIGSEDDFEEGTIIHKAVSHLVKHYGHGKYGIVLVNV